MLLNPSHTVSFSGLPPDILDAYVRYKKGTRALVAWLIQHSPSPGRRVKSLPLKELEAIAQTVSQSLQTLPDVVHFYFRETIGARKKLTKHFREQVDGSNEDMDTINHEHFTTSLSKIYEDLCTCCGTANAARNQKRRDQHVTSTQLSPVNLYDGLTVEECEAYGEDYDSHVSQPCFECSTATSPSCDNQGLGAHFADDQLGTVFGVTAAAQRIQEISSIVDNHWHRAASGDLSFIVASFVTNVAYGLLRQVGVELLEHDANLGLSNLYKICRSHQRSNGIEATSTGDREDCTYGLLDQCQRIEQTLLRVRDGGPLLVSMSASASRFQKPADYMQCPVPGHGDSNHSMLTVIIENVTHLLSNQAVSDGIISNSTPVCADVGNLFTHMNKESSSWASVLGLNLLTNGYKPYLQSTKSAQTVSRCRITALRLASQAASQIGTMLNDKTCFPCRCSQTLAFHLQNLEADLHSYERFKCWDLYFQAPWVAGNHVLEMLDLCHYYGTRLFNYRHYVGAVLHSYNVLKQLGGLEEIPVLESLCAQFTAIFFPAGIVPKGGFRASWARYAGARLKFKKGHRSRNSQDNWCMSVPHHAQRRAAGLGPLSDQPQARTDCLFFRIKQQEYHLSDDQWDSLGHDSVKPRQVQKNGKARRRDSTGTDQSLRSSTPPQKLIDLARTIQKSFEKSDTLPLARLNLFTVFEKCVCVISRLSDETHTSEHERGINCICFATSILTAGDRIVDGRRLGKPETWKKPERECVTQAKDVIRETFGNLEVEECLWDV